MVVKAKGVQVLVKTFNMPSVEAGSVIEYRYERILPEGYLYDSKWVLSEELFTKHAKFSLRPGHNGYGLNMSWRRGLPEGTASPVDDHHVMRLEIHDVPAFEIEDYMPPPDDLQYQVNFIYANSSEKEPEKFWNDEAKRFDLGIEAFTNKRKAMEQAVSEITLATDTPEQKLRKIYTRCQGLRNLSFEQEKTEQELSREKLKQIVSVEDVWKRGYGDGQEITWLFLALVRAAGFDASPVLIATRDKRFFDRRFMNAGELNTNVVMVRLNSRDMFLDPGVAFAPFGLLPWLESEVSGLRVSKDGGSWIVTGSPEKSTSGIERRAQLHLDDSGLLEGQATITFKGLSALGRRMDESRQDDAAHEKFLEDELKEYLPSTTEVKLTNKPDWASSSDILVAEFHIRIQDWISTAGHHLLLPVGLFSGSERHLFEQESRTHPIYYHYAYEDKDDVEIELPAGMQVSGLPKPQVIDGKICNYRSDVTSTNNSLHLHRDLAVNALILDSKYYGTLRNFYQQVRTGDEQQVVLSGTTSAAQN
jgi:hypothetical protein